MQINPDALEALRLRRGETQRSLAAKAGISVKSYNAIETGRTSPRVSTVAKLADALKLTVPYLVGVITRPAR